MKKKLNILAIIPARGGSKRLPGKNIKILSGKPLIAYAIEAAKKSRLVDRVIVSSDDPKIIEVARKHKAEVPFVRPSRLATDKAKVLDVLIHAVKFMEKNEKTNFDIVVLIQPTVPFVTSGDIDGAISKLIQTKTNTCASMREISERPEWMFKLDKSGMAKPAGRKAVLNRTQDLPVYHILNGAIYAIRRDTLMKYKKIFDLRSLSGLLMPKDRSVDIDDLTDFKIAESLMKK